MYMWDNLTKAAGRKKEKRRKKKCKRPKHEGGNQFVFETKDVPMKYNLFTIEPL